MSRTEKDIAYLKLLLSTSPISKREEIEILQEIRLLEEKKKKDGAIANISRLGISLYGSYFSSEVKLD